MSRKQFYRYNPSTDDYERVYPSRSERVRDFMRRFFFWAMVMGALITSIYLVVGTPREKMLRDENAQLKEQIDIMSRRVNVALDVMNDISARDDNFYRVMMGSPRVSSSRRYAGLDNENRYNYLNGLYDAELIKNLARKIDLLDRQLYTQIKSFDELQALAGSNSDRLAHIPSIQPIATKHMKQMASGYGYRRDPIYGTIRFHEGLDFAANIGVPIYATADGRVVSSGWETGYGQMVELDHGYGYRTRYAHLSKSIVKPGQSVKRGDKIAEVGNTGKSTGPHLHYEVRLNGVAQNPINYYMDLSPNEYNELIRQAENAGHVMD